MKMLGTQTFSVTTNAPTRWARHWHLLYLALAHDGMKTNPVARLHMYRDGSRVCRHIVWDEFNSVSDVWPDSEDKTLFCPPKAAKHGCLINASLLDDCHHKHYSKSTKVTQMGVLKALYHGRKHKQSHIKFQLQLELLWNFVFNLLS